jgi:CMP-N,N'-diacetyllegionaminic acid synthase
MKVLAVIPAKGFSSGLPNKNKLLLNGLPLVSYVVKAAKTSKLIDQLIISTDSDEIKLIGEEYGVATPYKRPENLSDNKAPLLAVVKNAYDYYVNLGIYFDAVLSIQPTCPFTSSRTIDNVIKTWSDTECESVMTVSEMTQGHPFTAKRLTKKMIISDFCDIPPNTILAPRQKREKAYFPTGGLYLRDKSLMDKDFSKENRHHFGDDHRAVIVDELESIDINDVRDFNYAQYILSKH